MSSTLDTICAGDGKIRTPLLLNLLDQRRRTFEPVYLNPNGFLQLSLTPSENWRITGLRLHIWPEEPLPRREGFQIHDHVIDIESYVLVGALQNVFYSVEEVEASNQGMYEPETMNVRNTLRPLNKKVLCREESSVIINAGNRYWLPKGKFHASVPTGVLTATVIGKGAIEEPRFPRIVGPVSGYSVGAPWFDRLSYNQDLAWQYVSRIEQELQQLSR